MSKNIMVSAGISPGAINYFTVPEHSTVKYVVDIHLRTKPEDKFSVIINGTQYDNLEAVEDIKLVFGDQLILIASEKEEEDESCSSYVAPPGPNVFGSPRIFLRVEGTKLFWKRSDNYANCEYWVDTKDDEIIEWGPMVIPEEHRDAWLTDILKKHNAGYTILPTPTKKLTTQTDPKPEVDKTEVERKFKVGDRVSCRFNFVGGDSAGKGVIIEVKNGPSTWPYIVEYDKDCPPTNRDGTPMKHLSNHFAENELELLEKVFEVEKSPELEFGDVYEFVKVADEHIFVSASGREYKEPFSKLNMFMEKAPTLNAPYWAWLIEVLKKHREGYRCVPKVYVDEEEAGTHKFSVGDKVMWGTKIKDNPATICEILSPTNQTKNYHYRIKRPAGNYLNAWESELELVEEKQEEMTTEERKLKAGDRIRITSLDQLGCEWGRKAYEQDLVGKANLKPGSGKLVFSGDKGILCNLQLNWFDGKKSYDESAINYNAFEFIDDDKEETNDNKEEVVEETESSEYSLVIEPDDFLIEEYRDQVMIDVEDAAATGQIAQAQKHLERLKSIGSTYVEVRNPFTGKSQETKVNYIFVKKTS